MIVTKLRVLWGVSGWVGLALALVAPLAAAGIDQCKLKPGLAQERKKLASEYASRVGRDYSRHQDVADSLTAKINEIDAEYYRFAYGLAELAVNGDTGSLAACQAASSQDEVGRQLAALVWYLHEGRSDPGSFIASLPHSKAQLADFWSMDTILAHGQRQEPSGLPGIPLPDGLVDKYLSELYILVGRGDPAAIREYVYLYSDADGDSREFMDDQATRLLEKRPALVLRHWTTFRPLAEKLGTSESVSREDLRSINANFKALCRERADRVCEDALKIFP